MVSDNDRSAWPPGAMRWYGWGFLAGIERGRELAEAEMARLHRAAYDVVQAHARGSPHVLHVQAVQARQVAACERNHAAAVPWPDEVTP
jgi:hypothetical protein